MLFVSERAKTTYWPLSFERRKNFLELRREMRLEDVVFFSHAGGWKTTTAGLYFHAIARQTLLTQKSLDTSTRRHTGAAGLRNRINKCFGEKRGLRANATVRGGSREGDLAEKKIG